jgi:hypothetical protein
MILDIITQKRIHDLTFRTIQELGLKILETPEIDHSYTTDYKFRPFATNHRVNLSDRNSGDYIQDSFAEAIEDELVTLWIALWEKGFAAWDFELFLQRNGKVMLAYYNRFGFRMTSGPRSIELPKTFEDPETGICVPDLRFFFHNKCFPRNFVSLLRAKGCEPPADCLPVERTKIE